MQEEQFIVTGNPIGDPICNPVGNPIRNPPLSTTLSQTLSAILSGACSVRNPIKNLIGNPVGNPIGTPTKNPISNPTFGNPVRNRRTSSERLPPTCPETFTMAENPKLSAVGGKNLARPAPRVGNPIPESYSWIQYLGNPLRTFPTLFQTFWQPCCELCLGTLLGMALLCLGTLFENPVGNVVGTLFENPVGNPVWDLCLKTLLVTLLKALLGTLVGNSVGIPLRNPVRNPGTLLGTVFGTLLGTLLKTLLGTLLGTGGNPAEQCPVLPRNLYKPKEYPQQPGCFEVRNVQPFGLCNSCREPYQDPCQEPCQILWWEPVGNLLRNLNGNWYLEFLGVAWTWN